MKIAIIGGTGNEGSGLATRWARAGHHVILGSRDAQKAIAKASELGDGNISGADNVAASAQAELVVLTVPYAAHRDTLVAIKPQLAGKVVIDVTVPLVPPKVTRVQLPAGRAAALEAQEIVGKETPVVAALHHVSHAWLKGGDESHCDVLMATDDDKARATVTALIADLGLRAIDAGPLDNAVALESLTPVLIHINKRYKVAGGSGLVITGVR